MIEINTLALRNGKICFWIEDFICASQIYEWLKDWSKQSSIVLTGC